MTNEEIRLNRYCKHCRNYDNGCDWLCRGMICNEADAYEMALDEKDRQVNEYMEKKKKSLGFRSDWVGFCSDICEGLLNEIINDLFGE